MKTCWVQYDSCWNRPWSLWKLSRSTEHHLHLRQLNSHGSLTGLVSLKIGSLQVQWFRISSSPLIQLPLGEFMRHISPPDPNPFTPTVSHFRAHVVHPARHVSPSAGAGGALGCPGSLGWALSGTTCFVIKSRRGSCQTCIWLVRYGNTITWWKDITW